MIKEKPWTFIVLWLFFFKDFLLIKKISFNDKNILKKITRGAKIYLKGGGIIWK